MNIINDIFNKISLFDLIMGLLISLSVLAVFVAIFIDFMKFGNRKSKNSKHSFVATGTMFIFFFLYYIVIVSKLFAIPTNWWVKIIGTIMIITGAIINILGRRYLGQNWANHIKIYDNHTLITTGVYKICRHPLYSSIMLMLFGGSVVFGNWLTAILTAGVFIPMMNYRAKQEEQMLIQKFLEYKEYMKKTRRFI